MALDFTKNTVNLFQLPASTIGNLMQGSTKVSFHTWVNIDTIDGGAQLQNYIAAFPIASGNDGISWGIDGTSGNKLFVRGRSQAADSGQIRLSTSSIATGQWVSVGGVFNFIGNSITPYVSGTAENGATVTFGSTSYVQSGGNPTTDCIGGEAAGAHTTLKQTDGRIAEVSLWNNDIGATGFQRLANGVSALQVSPSNLKVYFRLIGNGSEIDLKSGLTGTITGTLPQAYHPPISSIVTPYFLGQYADSNNASTYTFSNLPLGNPSVDRYIVAGIQSRNNGTSVSLTTCIIAGTQATIDGYNKYSPDNSNHSAIVRANIPTGTTGDITITFGGSTTMLRCGLTLWDVKGINPTPYSTTSQSSTLTGQLTTKTINCLGGGLVVASATGGANAHTSESWSGLQEATSTIVETFFAITTATLSPATTTAIPVSTSFVGTNFSECNNIIVSYQPTMTLSDNLVSYWKLDETSGSAIDSVGTNTLVPVNSPTGTLGKIGSSRSFALASSQYLTTADTPSLEPLTTDFTIAGWVFLKTKPASIQTFVSKYNTTGNQRSYQLNYDNTVDRFTAIVSPDGTFTSASVVTANTFGSPSTSTWYFLATNYNSITRTLGISVNNGAMDILSFSGGAFDSTANFRIGNQDGNVNYVDGLIDEVGFWKRVLTSSEISQLYNSGNGLTYPFDGGTTTVQASFTASATANASFVGSTNTFLNSLISYWRLDETSGNAIDSSGFNTLTAINSPTSTTGKISTARLFSSTTSQYFNIGTNATLQTGDIDFTWTAWVWMNSKPAAQMEILSKYNTGTNNREYRLLWLNTTDRFFAQASADGTTGNAVSVQADNFGAPTTSTWYFLTLQHNSSANTYSLSVNNTTPNSAGISSVYVGNSPFAIGSIGAFGGGGVYWDGRIDEVGFWKRLLTASEITRLYNSGNGLTYPFTSALVNNLVSYWKLDETSGSAIDSVGSNTLTAVNSPTSTTGKISTARAFSSTSTQQFYNNTIASTTADRSVGLWLNITSQVAGGTQYNLVGLGITGATRNFTYDYRNQSGVKCFEVAWSDNSGNYEEYRTPYTLQTGTFYYCAATWSPVNHTCTFYINGTSSIAPMIGTTRSAWTAGAQTLQVGSFGNFSFMNAIVDEVGYWNRQLSTSEISQLYNSGNGLTYPFESNTTTVQASFTASATANASFVGSSRNNSTFSANGDANTNFVGSSVGGNTVIDNGELIMFFM